ncbi:MAG TPA: 16S rRNA (cytidine(1402)-2'-O)-methyltransferase [Dehalococcoidia bacterium]|nr:16S rRNA (cytidine(1402)-2'-O)-methyltransferase [Dehalococcoidia bacterium]
MGALYLVATPIGNLEDITLRALRVLKEVGLVAAEDTRTARILFRKYGIETPLISYHDYNKKARLPRLLEVLQGEDVALISEAGMPGISDPGYELVVACVERGIKIVPVPGASAILTALAASGLPTHSFLYLGFLPRKKGERQRLLEAVAPLPHTLVFMEAPHRLSKGLEDLREVLGERRMAVGRELTKLHEEFFRGTVSQALEHFSQPRGEFTLIVEGALQGKKELGPEVEAELLRLRQEGLRAKEAVARLASKTGLPRREIYRAWLRAKGAP